MKRNSNIEFLRVLMMFLIVLNHVAFHGVLNNGMSMNLINTLIINFFTIGGKLGVNIFILISGYYLIFSESETSNYKNIKNIYITVFICSIGSFLIMLAIGNEVFNIKKLLYAALPLRNNIYWFFTYYLIMYILFPYVNKFLLSLNKNNHYALLKALFVIVIVSKSILKAKFTFSPLILFILLYSVGAYERRYSFTLSRKDLNLRIIITIVISFLSVLILNVLSNIIPSLHGKENIFLIAPESILSFFLSIYIFLKYVRKPFFENKIINAIGSLTFIIYLLHDNPFVKKYWLFLFSNHFEKTSGTNIFFLYVIVFSILIFIFSIVFACIIKIILKGIDKL